MSPPVAPRRRLADSVGGTATVEFCAIAPFVLALLAAVWDLREHIAHRTDTTRHTYVATEAFTRQLDGGTPPFAAMLAADNGPLGTRLRKLSVAGAVSAALVVRGTTRHDGTACPPDAWCPPAVARGWPADDVDRVWGDGADHACTGPATLPAAGSRFGPGETVLPEENPDPDDPRPEQHWISRNLDPTEWWVVIDVCVEPRPGRFIGRLTQLSVELLDIPFALRKRVAWASVHDRGDCLWC